MCNEYLYLILLFFRYTNGTNSLHIKMFLSTCAYCTLQSLVAVWKGFGRLSTYSRNRCIDERIRSDCILKYTQQTILNKMFCITDSDCQSPQEMFYSYINTSIVRIGFISSYSILTFSAALAACSGDFAMTAPTGCP